MTGFDGCGLMATPLKRSKDVLCQQLEDEAVLLDLRSERYFGLDELGARIWELLGQTADLQQVWQTLRGEYAVDGVTLERDLNRFVTQLLEADLLEPVSSDMSDASG